MMRTRLEWYEVLTTGGDKKYSAGGVYNQKQVEEILRSGKTLIAHTTLNYEGEDYEFFSNNHIFGYGLLPNELFVSCSMSTPCRVVPRIGCEDGLIDTFLKYKAVYGRNTKFIWSLNELVDYLDMLGYVEKDVI